MARRVIGTAGLMVLFVVGMGRHTMALGGSGWTNVVFAVGRRSGLAYQGSASTLALVPAGTNSSGRRAAGVSRDQAAAAAVPVGRNSVPSRHMRWRMIESFRATATLAFLNPDRFARPRPHTCRAEGRRMRVRMTFAAS